jgi:DNA-binding MarR family transcriptional regulator
MTKEVAPREGLSGRRGLAAEDPIGQQLQEISRLTRQIEKKLGDLLEVNLTDLMAMEHLMSRGPLTPSDLATRLGVTTAAGTLIVDRLERAGHVSRQRHESDRRKVLVVPSAASVKRAFEEITPTLQGLDALFARISASERKVIERFLGQLVDLYRVAAAPPKPPR